MVNPLLVVPHEFRPSPEDGLKEICIACGQWEFHRVHYDHLKAELQRLTKQQAAERVSSEPFDGAMLRSGPNGTREWFGPAPEASPSVDAVDPSAGTQERGPRAYEDL